MCGRVVRRRRRVEARLRGRFYGRGRRGGDARRRGGGVDAVARRRGVGAVGDFVVLRDFVVRGDVRRRRQRELGRRVGSIDSGLLDRHLSTAKI
jgi:hypothetical protein